MDVEFLGGGNEVGRLGIYIAIDGSALLFDYGLTPGEPPEYPKQAPPVDNVFLSHAHLDHSGMTPWLSGRYDAPIHATTVTQEIASLLFKDTLKIAEANGYPFPYGKTEVQRAINNFITVNSRETVPLESLTVNTHPSGHIPGGILFEIEGPSTVFACDINTIDTRLLFGAQPVPCETLFLEGTYAGQNHTPRHQLEQEFLDTVDEVVQRGGTAVIPAFAVGRSQEIAMILQDCGHDVWLDGMGSRVAEILLRYPDSIRAPGSLEKAFNSLRVVYSQRGRDMAQQGDVIITTSGMMNGGPVLGYVDAIRNDAKSAIILTGYQVDGTNGRRLLEYGQIEMFGVTRRIGCPVHFFDFSAHAGHEQLVDYARACRADTVVVFHSDDPQPLADDIRDFATKVYTPQNGQPLVL
jgi:putative mRNA 3-end processing factor